MHAAKLSQTTAAAGLLRPGVVTPALSEMTTDTFETRNNAMPKRTELTFDNARAIADALGVRLYQRESGDPKSNAQANLAGRTHYVDADTMRAFHSRIRTTATTDHGTVFMIVESVSADYQHRSRGFRFVAFDLTGTVLNDRASNDTLHRTGDKADAAMWAWADSFDAAAYHRDLLKARAEKAKADAVTMAKLARTLAA